MHSLGEIEARIKRAAHEAGFELAGIAPVRDLAELNYFPEWIAAGRAGEMTYLEARDESGNLKRASLRRAAPWARSVIVCAINYNTSEPYSTEAHDSMLGWISRYAWSREDYHDSVMRRLRIVEQRLREAVAELEERANLQVADRPAGKRRSGRAVAGPGSAEGIPIVSQQKQQQDPASGLLTRCYVDTGPVVERVYAKYAGVGWIGKNTCTLNQKMGSWLFLGVILTSLELAPDLPAPDRCGKCTRCIDACPTDALITPYQLDSNLCISYLTIEKRGEIPEPMRAGLGRHVFGCDICQDVCPWNRKAPATTAAEFQPRDGLVNPELIWLAEVSAEEFRDKFRGSAVRRTKRNGLRRNAILAMGNSGNREFVPALRRLVNDEDSIVADSARWALRRLEGTSARSTAEEAFSNQQSAISRRGNN